VAVIHGDSLDGKDLTLLDAFVTSRRGFISYGHNVEQFRFNKRCARISAHFLRRVDELIRKIPKVKGKSRHQIGFLRIKLAERCLPAIARRVICR